jgi:very-short-patch-repair endonuclease
MTNHDIFLIKCFSTKQNLTIFTNLNKKNMYTNNFYNPNLKSYASELRTTSVSKAEKRIWKALLSREQLNERFLRQRPIKNFIVDFFCPKLGLIIEIDGSSHINKGTYDFYREEKLKTLGYTIIRFQEGEVLSQLDDVKSRIIHVIYVLNNEI